MLFHTLEFLIFFAIVFSLYSVLSHRWQNYMLLVASMTFYGWWDVRFLLLMGVSATIDFIAAIKIDATDDQVRRKRWLLEAVSKLN